MDPHIRYWDVSERKIVVRYWNPRFLGHTRSDDLVKAFNNGLNELDLTKLIQISMGGPSLNLKFLSEIKKLKINNELASLLILAPAPATCNHLWNVQN